MRDCCLRMLLVLLLSEAAAAQVTDLEIVQVDNSRGGAALENFVTNDVLVDFAGQYTGAQLLLKLTEGSIYLNPVGGFAEPDPVFFPLSPELEFASYLKDYRPPWDFPEPGPGGGAVDLGGSSEQIIEPQCVSAVANPPGGATVLDETDYHLARLTMSSDARGTMHLLVSAAGSPMAWRDIPIAGGVIGVPEPATAALVLAGVAICSTVRTRRGRNRTASMTRRRETHGCVSGSGPYRSS